MSLPEIYVIHPNGCGKDPTITFNGLTCDMSRGGLFKDNLSTSFIPGGVYDVSANAAFHDFGYTQVAGKVGLESLKLNLPKETDNGGNNGTLDNEILKDLTVAEISAYNFTWLGMLGLDVRRTNFSEIGGMKLGQENMMSVLKRNKMIPSLSWAYTAGSRWCKSILFP